MAQSAVICTPVFFYLKANFMNHYYIVAVACIAIIVVTACSDTTTQPIVNNFGGYSSQEKWGEHLVLIGGCNDCHTPKKMGPKGPEFDTSLLLSGHPAQMPIPPVDRKDMEAKGIAATQTLTAWVGPWGVSYASNLTSDSSGIGGWTEEQFLRSIRKGLYKGIEGSRPLLPPMPWEGISNFTDDELKAIFSYLKSTAPIKNIVTPAQPPVSAGK